MKKMIFQVDETARLLEFLFTALPDKSRTTVKSYLTRRQVSVNHVVTTQFDRRLKPGDRVEISAEKGRPEFRHAMMRIIYEERAWLGLLYTSRAHET
ncbi:MAG: hypothetical protein LUD68_08005 [Rikenellaceae bacterium]|nr:hypothetical protein [Rikenellaceae bacterium]